MIKTVVGKNRFKYNSSVMLFMLSLKMSPTRGSCFYFLDFAFEPAHDVLVLITSSNNEG